MTRAVAAHGLVVTADGAELLRNLSFSLEAHTITGLIGPSGSGKTTLMRALVGEQSLAAGTLSVLGHPAGTASLRREVAYMPQAAGLYLDLTVRENVAYFAAMVDGDRGSVEHVLGQVDLTEQTDRVVRNLSGGQRQRVSLAIALLGEPRLLILDEPTTGLDPVLRESLWRLLRELVAAGVTIIISSHAMDEAARCDDLLLLRDGQILAHDTPDTLMRRTNAKSVEAAFIHLVEAV